MISEQGTKKYIILDTKEGLCHSNKTQICYHAISSQMIKVHLWNDYLGEINWNDFQLPYSFFMTKTLSEADVESKTTITHV